jgi:hypothetical protein
VMTLAADDAEGKELRAMMDIIKSLKVKAK